MNTHDLDEALRLGVAFGRTIAGLTNEDRWQFEQAFAEAASDAIDAFEISHLAFSKEEISDYGCEAAIGVVAKQFVKLLKEQRSEHVEITRQFGAEFLGIGYENPSEAAWGSTVQGFARELLFVQSVAGVDEQHLILSFFIAVVQAIMKEDLDNHCLVIPV